MRSPHRFPSWRRIESGESRTLRKEVMEILAEADVRVARMERRRRGQGEKEPFEREMEVAFARWEKLAEEMVQNVPAEMRKILALLGR